MAKIDGGCTLWARQTIDSEIFYYKPDKWFKIWFYLVSKVNHKDNRLFKRGEGLVTYEDIAYKTKATKTQIEKCLKWLRREGMLDERRTTRGNIKIVSKYDTFQDMKTYQKNGETNDKTIERRIEDEQKAVPINKNDKNVKNDKNNIKKIDFSIFWNLYDKKTDKVWCENKWNSLKLSEQQEITRTLPSYVKSTFTNGKFPSRKNPKTYLNNKCWEDEVEEKKIIW